MALSNSERQARYRWRKRAEALDRIRCYEAMRKKALDWVKAIDSGQRHYTAIGSAPMRDCTDELREEQCREAQMFESFIELWRKDADQSV